MQSYTKSIKWVMATIGIVMLLSSPMSAGLIDWGSRYGIPRYPSSCEVIKIDDLTNNSAKEVQIRGHFSGLYTDAIKIPINYGAITMDDSHFYTRTGVSPEQIRAINALKTSDSVTVHAGETVPNIIRALNNPNPSAPFSYVVELCDLTTNESHVIALVTNDGPIRFDDLGGRLKILAELGGDMAGSCLNLHIKINPSF